MNIQELNLNEASSTLTVLKGMTGVIEGMISRYRGSCVILAAVLAAAAAPACNGREGGGDASPDQPGDVGRDSDAVIDPGQDDGLDPLPDMAVDEAVDASSEGAPDGSPDGAGGGGPALIYNGPRDDGAVVPEWDPGNPRPLIMYSRYSSEPVWHVSMAEVSEAGVVGGMVTDLVRFWGWEPSSPDAPALLFEGLLDAGARVPGWSGDGPLPVIVLARPSGIGTWWVSMAQIAEDGLVSGIVADEVKVWGWASDGAPGAPDILYAGPVGPGAVVPGWSLADPRPLIVLTRHSSGQTWWISMAEVSETGVVGGVVTDELRFWGW